MNLSTLLRGAMCVTALTALTAQAVHVTPQQALQRATGDRAMVGASMPLNALQLARTINDSADQAAIYVMSSNSHYVLLSADDCAPAVLGYGDNFDPEQIPTNMQWWLNSYADQISFAAANGLTCDPKLISRPAIDYLVQTTWNQSAPYNNLCPTLNGSRSVTGCVATAMAQVINYHRCPAGNGTGSHAYTWQGQALSFNYGNTTFDWTNMLNSYKGSYTTAQATAVATLMYACGVGVNMNYSPSESGASSVRIAGCLIDHFGFDPSTRYVERDYYSEDQWDELIYSELQAGRPVLYSGQSTTSGHQFVCDGYSSNGYYHINWGWGGTSDGYFLLSLLDPYTQGIGGSTDNKGYRYDQNAVIGIQPRQDPAGEAQLSIFANGGFEYSDQYRGYWFGTTAQGANGFFNYSTNTANILTGVALTDADGNVQYMNGENESIDGITDNGLIPGKSIIRAYLPFELAAGEYHASPVVLPEGGNAWQPIAIPYGQTQYVTVRVADNGAFTYDGSDPAGLDAPCYAQLQPTTTEFVPNTQVSVLTTFYNPSGNATTFYPSLMLFDSNGLRVGSLAYYTLNLTSNSIRYNLTYSVPQAPDGVYTLCALDYGKSRFASEPVKVYIGTVPTSISIEPTAEEVFTGSTLQLTASVLPADAFDTTVTWTSSDDAVATVDADGVVTAIAPGEVTITATTINDLTAETVIIVTLKAGVADVRVDAEASTVEVFDVNGRCVGTSVEGLTPGIYMIKRGTTVTKQVVR